MNGNDDNKEQRQQQQLSYETIIKDLGIGRFYAVHGCDGMRSLLYIIYYILACVLCIGFGF